MAVTTDRFPQWLISEYNTNYSGLPQTLKSIASIARGTFNSAILKSVDQDASGASARLANGQAKVGEYSSSMYSYGDSARPMYATLMRMQQHAEKVVANNLGASARTKAAMQRSEAAATAAYTPPVEEQSESDTWWKALKQSVKDVISGDPLRAKREQNMSWTELYDPATMDYAATGNQQAALDMGEKLRGESCHLFDVKCHLKKNKWAVIGGGVAIVAIIGLILYIQLAPSQTIEIKVT